MNRTWGLLAIVIMLTLSLWFLSGSGLIRLAPLHVDASSFPHLRSLFLNRQGNKQLEAQNFQAAFDAYVKTLQFEPFSPETHLNLGLSFEGQQQAAKAMPSYKNALQYAKDDELKFMAYFNQAQLLGKEKKVDEALELYQKALEIDPTSKEVKTNIELLIQTQQQSGGGENQQQDQNQQQNQQEKDQQQKDQQQKDQNQNKQDQKNQQNQQDQKDQKDPNQPQDQGQKDQEKKDKKENPQYAPNQKHQPRPFKGKELSEGDVKKILGEIRQQEQKIRSEYNRKEVKEQPRDKDW